MSNYRENFINVVIEYSENKDWSKAVLEWGIINWELDESENSVCVCGKENIKYLFTIKNLKNGNVLHPIGSRCIKKFNRNDLNDITSEKEALFKLLNKVKNQEFLDLKDGSFSRKLLEFFYKQGVFKPNSYNEFNGENDYFFLLQMFNKRKEPTIKQTKKIRALILQAIKPFLIDQLEDKILKI